MNSRISVLPTPLLVTESSRRKDLIQLAPVAEEAYYLEESEEFWACQTSQAKVG